MRQQLGHDIILGSPEQAHHGMDYKTASHGGRMPPEDGNVRKEKKTMGQTTFQMVRNCEGHTGTGWSASL